MLFNLLKNNINISDRYFLSPKQISFASAWVKLLDEVFLINQLNFKMFNIIGKVKQIGEKSFFHLYGNFF